MCVHNKGYIALMISFNIGCCNGLVPNGTKHISMIFSGNALVSDHESIFINHILKTKCRFTFIVSYIKIYITVLLLETVFVFLYSYSVFWLNATPLTRKSTLAHTRVHVRTHTHGCQPTQYIQNYAQNACIVTLCCG